MSVVIFTLILSFLVIIHELGHYVAARWAKIKVLEFGLGYPPRAKKLFTRAGTIFSLNWIPFGGFVQMLGEDEDGQADSPAAKKHAFYAQPAWKRLIVILAGATVNFWFGVVAFAIVFSVSGIPVPINQARIESITPQSPAETAGLPAGVNIIAVKYGEEVVPITTYEDVVTAVEKYRGKTVTIVTTGKCDELSCQESAQEFTSYLRTPEETPAGQGPLGVAFQTLIFKHYPWYEMPFRGAWYGLMQALWLGGAILQGLGQLGNQLFSQGTVPQDIAGPVGIVHQAQSSGIFSEGFLAVLGFAGMLSVNLAIMNVLPIPALDGGRALFIVLQQFVKRERLAKIEKYAHYAGFIFLISLIVLVTARDIFRIFAS